MLLENETVLVTGASRGIGMAIADLMGAQGATVIGTATSTTGSDVISKRFSDAGYNGKGMQLDVTDVENSAGIVESIKNEYGGVSVLVNNAGITRDNLLMRMKDEEWEDILQTNLTSVFRMTKLCLRGMMKAKHGRVISIASVVGVTGNPGQANYAAAKAGIIGFSKSLAREIGSRGITVNTIAPGFIMSDMTNALSDVQKEALVQNIALGRLGTPDEVAQTALYLASAMANYVTGQTLHVNGGMYMG